MAPLSYWIADDGPLDDLASWKELDLDTFRAQLGKAADRFPRIDDPDRNSEQKHMTIFVHGFNNTWSEAAERYAGLCRDLYQGDDSLGLCVLFTWPSDGHAWDYLPDRKAARDCASDLSEVLNELHDWMVEKQVAGSIDPRKACKAKTSVIAHSMGNYVLQKALEYTWTRKNRPLLVSLLSQLIMVAADVDNDLFASGENVDGSDGDAMANLCYRISALYSGRDEVLGISAGLKHFGKRRLGRSGLDSTVQEPDNVWDFDCSPLFPADQPSIHSAYFDVDATKKLLRRILQGADRGIIQSEFGPH